MNGPLNFLSNLVWFHSPVLRKTKSPLVNGLILARPRLNRRVSANAAFSILFDAFSLTDSKSNLLISSSDCAIEILDIPNDCARIPNINSVGEYLVTVDFVLFSANWILPGWSRHVLFCSFSTIVSKLFNVLMTLSTWPFALLEPVVMKWRLILCSVQNFLNSAGN